VEKRKRTRKWAKRDLEQLEVRHEDPEKSTVIVALSTMGQPVTRIGVAISESTTMPEDVSITKSPSKGGEVRMMWRKRSEEREWKGKNRKLQ